MSNEKKVACQDKLQISDDLDLLHDVFEIFMHSIGKVSNMKIIDPDLLMQSMNVMEYENR